MAKQVGDVEFLGSFPDAPPETGLPEVAFAGRSNVGKSSAINTLLGRKAIARVSGTPGRTQTINLFKVDKRLVFCDLPGYGFAKVPPHLQEKWKESIESYLGTREALRLVVVLVDARRDPLPGDGQMIYALTEIGVPCLVVATKIDKLGRNERNRNLDKLRREFRLTKAQCIGFSALSKEGRDEVWAVLDEACRG